MVRCPRRGHRRPDGGTRAEGLRDGVVAAFNAYARVRGLLKATDPDPGADLIGEGLTVVVSVKPDHPECRGCHTRRAGGAAVRRLRRGRRPGTPRQVAGRAHGAGRGRRRPDLPASGGPRSHVTEPTVPGQPLDRVLADRLPPGPTSATNARARHRPAFLGLASTWPSRASSPPSAATND
ncbi:hypothetical protein ACF1FX_30960 [Streptomyces sp. NPDC014646]|uniref:hypothetical protein n=1 Tax=Streptomyces sp. NPDC014646 TaxID=3364877 RepID=UPI0036F8217A